MLHASGFRSVGLRLPPGLLRGCPAAVRVVSAIQLIESRTRVACTVTVQTPAKGDLFLFCLLHWPLCAPGCAPNSWPPLIFPHRGGSMHLPVWLFTAW